MSVEKVQRNITNLFNYPSDENPTTQADYINAVKNWVETIVNLVDCNLWQPETEYSVGNYLRTPSLPSQVVLRCTTAGISGTEEPDYSEAEIGDTIADGSIEWTIQTMASLNELDAYFAEIIARIENGEGVVDTMWETDLETDIQPISATNVVPKVNGTGTLGTASKKWANIYANGLNISGTATAVTPADDDDSNKVATTEFVHNITDNKAPLNSPTLTGTPTAPTPTSGDDSTKIATTEYVQEEIRQHANMPIGFEYFTMNPSIPQGSLPLFGGEYSRETYSDLWAWVQEQTGYLKTEAEWQTLSTANNGNVPYYSDGDGSTTFRVPSLKCWVKSANGTVSEVGSYLEAGLPNITGKFGVRGATSVGIVGTASSTYNGAFDITRNSFGYKLTASTGSDTNTCYNVNFDASNSNSIYGNANTVQPESIVGLWLVKAYGVIVDTGQIDEQQYIDDRLATKLSLTGGTMLGAIKGDSLTLTAENGGNSASLVLNNSGSATWNGKEVERVNASGTDYIRYDSGLQICWGYVAASSSGTTVTFTLPFVSNPRVVVSNAQISTHASYDSLSPTSVSLYNNSTNSSQVSYIAVGKWK